MEELTIVPRTQWSVQVLSIIASLPKDLGKYALLPTQANSCCGLVGTVRLAFGSALLLAFHTWAGVLILHPGLLNCIPYLIQRTLWPAPPAPHFQWLDLYYLPSEFLAAKYLPTFMLPDFLHPSSIPQILVFVSTWTIVVFTTMHLLWDWSLDLRFIVQVLLFIELSVIVATKIDIAHYRLCTNIL